MRISREQVAENRERLLRIADEQFREHGIDGVGLAKLTAEAGMSLGSFYRYFDSKDQLVSECCIRAIAATRSFLEDSLGVANTDPVAHTADLYLSPKHRDSRGKGCVLAALGSEMTHQSKAVRRAASAALEDLFTHTAANLPGRSRKQKQDFAMATMASLVGGLILSRMMDDPARAQQVLNAVKASVKQSASAS